MTRAAFVIGALLVPLPVSGGDASGPGDLSLSDLAAYRAALDGRPPGAAEAVTFRALWERPDHYRGRRVKIEGRVVRRFRQGAYGTFPPLVEAWAVSPAGDPFCLVFPDPAPNNDQGKGGEPPARSGQGPVAFEGVFLRQVRYEGGDTARLAPLIVGDRAPRATGPAEGPPTADGSGDRDGFSRLDWLIGVGATLFVGLVLAKQHLRRPPQARRASTEGPPPEFIDPS